jgi:hypothetical protein
MKISIPQPNGSRINEENALCTAFRYKFEKNLDNNSGHVVQLPVAIGEI